ncbi:hypothetical protein JIX56_46030 [Streptomyces sp. CA-210063]|uniref:hypothetical protein n=1 Tax=Streptomyces sp. CA-210063 TaxID=2801029 RepID=UPI00214AD95A|nr:hypothetical protein [Streptomyces sp. CA-210063]UUU36589.1 hypothetical protein JIX56_46030 [Streptomyces sp. CA-210063]
MRGATGSGFHATKGGNFLFKDLSIAAAAIAGHTLDLLDENADLCSPGVVGEVCVSGMGLAGGTWGARTVPAARYISHPVRPGRKMFRVSPMRNIFRPGRKMFRIGETAKRLSDGGLLLLGRTDGQRVEEAPARVTAGIRRVQLGDDVTRRNKRACGRAIWGA